MDARRQSPVSSPWPRADGQSTAPQSSGSGPPTASVTTTPLAHNRERFVAPPAASANGCTDDTPKAESLPRSCQKLERAGSLPSACRRAAKLASKPQGRLRKAYHRKPDKRPTRRLQGRDHADEAVLTTTDPTPPDAPMDPRTKSARWAAWPPESRRHPRTSPLWTNKGNGAGSRECLALGALLQTTQGRHRHNKLGSLRSSSARQQEGSR